MYRIQLKDFEGPLDLLLFLIRRDELDIFDIPIAAITHEYLEYVRVLEDIDLDGAADFIYMAALLIGIKARMLLPSPETDDESEALDPRQELVERLLEYRRYKEAAEKLGTLSEERSMLFTRGKASAPQFEAVLPEKTGQYLHLRPDRCAPQGADGGRRGAGAANKRCQLHDRAAAKLRAALPGRAA